MNKNFAIAIHGGAGTILRSQMTAEKEKVYTTALESCLQVGLRILQSGGSSLDAVEATIIELENCPFFNAGKGSVFTNDGKHEMDASIMNGANLDAGAVAMVQRIKNPITLARSVMEKTEHVFLCGEGAEKFARSINAAFVDDKYFFDQLRYDQWQQVKDTGITQLDHVDEKKFGTVGCVAIDMHGNLAAGTSTGGMTNKRYGRVGDTPMIGAGTYANNKTCAVSCTGHGEYFIKAVVAYDVACLMEYKNLSLHDACNIVVNEKLKTIGGEGGLIAIDKNGNIELSFNSDGMYRAHAKSDGVIKVEIYK
ncbi:MAG: isoaspartyl peptidase/L-asparaginase [Bacteroidia bacterium]